MSTRSSTKQPPPATPQQRDPSQYTAEEVAQIAERLEKNSYSTLFGCLEDWHTLKGIAFHSPNLVAPYVHLLEMEIDED